MNVVYAAQVSGLYINLVSLYTLWHIGACSAVAIAIKHQCKVIGRKASGHRIITTDI